MPVTHNKSLNHLLNLLISCISTKFVPPPNFVNKKLVNFNFIVKFSNSWFVYFCC